MVKRKTFKDFYLGYKYRYDVRDPKYVDKKEYTNILNEFFKLLSKEIMEEALVYKIPHKIGVIRIKKFKAKKQAIDWKKTNDYFQKHGVKKHIYHFNNHSGGYSGRWYWDKKEAILKNRTLYKFTPTRTNKRTLADLIIQQNTIKKYFE